MEMEADEEAESFDQFWSGGLLQCLALTRILNRL
jgi:hypothetical protein